MKPYLVLENDAPLATLPPQDPHATRLDRSVEGSFGAIQALPLFQNIAPFVVFEILHAAHIVSHNKGALILSQGESLTHFCVILEGYVKLFKNSQDGREATLQILGKKDFLYDTGMTGDPARSPISPMNVQVVENVRLLTIPLSVMREHFIRSSALAENLLTLFVQRTQNILLHLENLTLRNAKERVGFLLLKIWMETNPNGMDVTLPFDKSLIAAYLDIRAETFSRILKDLQKDGFRINGLHVTLPNPTALCCFCDPATAINCQHAAPHCLEARPLKPLR